MFFRRSLAQEHYLPGRNEYVYVYIHWTHASIYLGHYNIRNSFLFQHCPPVDLNACFPCYVLNSNKDITSPQAHNFRDDIAKNKNGV